MALQDSFAQFISERFDANSDNERRILHSENDNRKKIEGYLLSTLNDAQKELYNELQEINTELQGKWEFNAYSLGFVDGIILAGRL